MLETICQIEIKLSCVKPEKNSFCEQKGKLQIRISPPKFIISRLICKISNIDLPGIFARKHVKNKIHYAIIKAGVFISNLSPTTFSFSKTLLYYQLAFLENCVYKIQKEIDKRQRNFCSNTFFKCSPTL